MNRRYHDRGKTFRDEWAEDGTTLLFESALENVMDEIKVEHAAGLIRPFVEGEPIGTIRTDLPLRTG